MIDLYYWPTPNGQKASIMLEETGLEYANNPINILKGDQFGAAFLKFSPNNKIPAIIDHDGPGGGDYAVFESGAVLMYLAEKTGKFLPTDPRERYDVIQWLMFQMGSVGPMFGQCGHFLGYAPEKFPYSIERYQNETLRLYGVMDKQLSSKEYIAGTYSIADIAIYPWVDVRWLHEIDITQFPNVERWYNQIGKRPAVQRGMALLKEQEKIGDPTEETREIFFGKSQLNQSD